VKSRGRIAFTWRSLAGSGLFRPCFFSRNG